MSVNEEIGALLARLHAADPASVTAIGEVVAERLRQIEGEGWGDRA